MDDLKLSPEELKIELRKMEPKLYGLKTKVAERTGLSYPTTRNHLEGKGRYYKMMQTYRAAKEVLKDAVGKP